MDQPNHRKFLSTVLFLTTILNTPQRKAEAKECNTTIIDGDLKALCSNYGLTSIPANLDPNIKEMELSGNPIKEIKRSEIQRYRELLNFTFTGANKTSNNLKIEADAFTDLLQLEYLDLSYNFGLDTKMIFPTNLVRIRLIHTFQNSTTLDLSKLAKLRVANLDMNLLTGFPTFHKLAPLQEVSLEGNPLNAIPVINFARYCKLERLNVNVKDIKPMLSDSCECPRLKEWIRIKAIKGFKPPDFQCTLEKQLKCPDLIITDEIKQLHLDCQNHRNDSQIRDREKSASPFQIRFIVLVVVYVAIIFSMVAAIYWIIKTHIPIIIEEVSKSSAQQ